MSLADLPSEVLSLILSSPSFSWAAIEFWKCGDRRLNSKLALRGVESIWLQAQQNSLPQALPKCLSQFRLRSLSISARQGVSNPDGLHDFFKSLNPGLKSLSFTGKGAVEAIFPVTPKEGEFTPDRQPWDFGGRSNIVYNVENLNLSQLHDWSITFPELEELKVGLLGALRTVSPVLGDYIFPFLPRSLIALDISYTKSSGFFENFEHLPTPLRILYLPAYVIKPSHLRQLPKTLTSIGDSLTPNALLELATEPQILPNLEIFPNLGTEGNGEEIIDSCHSQNKMLPQALKALYLAIELPALKILPSTLTSLEVENVRDIAQYLPVLPRQLERIKLSNANWNKIEASHIWPPNLTHLHLTCDILFGPRQFHLLPRALTTLIANDMAHAGTSTKPASDLNVEAIMALGISLLSESESTKWSSLKEELRKKVETATGRYWKSQLDNYISMVESGALFGLPLHLTNLQLGPLYEIEAFDLVFPPRVSHLLLEFKTPFDRISFWNLLPPSLTSLVSQSTAWIPSQAPKSWSICQLADPSACTFYHSNVSHFEFWDTNKLNSPFCFLKALPRNLRSLEIHFDSIYRQAEVLTLPPKLERLLYTAIVPSPEWCATLPPTLRTLENLRMKGAHLATLPPKIEQLKVIIKDVTLDMLLALPPTMQCLLPSQPSSSQENSLYLTDVQWLALAPLCVSFGRVRERSKAELLKIIEKQY